MLPNSRDRCLATFPQPSLLGLAPETGRLNRSEPQSLRAFDGGIRNVCSVKRVQANPRIGLASFEGKRCLEHHADDSAGRVGGRICIIGQRTVQECRCAAREEFLLLPVLRGLPSWRTALVI